MHPAIGNKQVIALNERDAIRIAVDEAREMAILGDGERRVEVDVVNRSSGGFGIECVGHPGFETQQILVLVTETGAFKVRVAQIHEEPPTSGGAGDSIYHIGLERQADLDSQADWLRDNQGNQKKRPRFLELKTSFGRAFVEVLLMVGLGVVVLIGYLAYAARSADESSVLQEWIRAFQQDDENASPPIPVGLTNPPENPPQEGLSPSVRKAIQVMPTSLALALKGVAGELSLSVDQIKTLNTINREAWEARKLLLTQERDLSRAEVEAARTRILERSRQQALDMFNPSQRRQWEEWRRPDRSGPDAAVAQ